MDDMLGTILDISDSTQKSMDWIGENSGWDNNALYVTADHDHYLTVNDRVPEALANLLIQRLHHKAIPGLAIYGIHAGRHEDKSKSVTEHLSDFSTWVPEDMERMAHFWGPRGSGGKGWSSHSTRPVPLYSKGDDGCLGGLVFEVAGKEVRGSPGKVDQNLFGL